MSSDTLRLWIACVMKAKDLQGELSTRKWCGHVVADRQCKVEKLMLQNLTEPLTHALVFATVQPAKRFNSPDEFLKVETTILISIKQLEDAHDKRVAG